MKHDYVPRGMQREDIKGRVQEAGGAQQCKREAGEERKTERDRGKTGRQGGRDNSGRSGEDEEVNHL